MLIFVDRQELADELFRRLMEKGHLCRSLHGGMDQDDRDDALTDFKKGICNILVATSIVARGLDVRQLHLVINYEVPNHYEDYVHRCGRTGRAGNKGEAYTFITEEQDKFAVDIVKALELSHQDVPKRLKDLAEEFNRKVKEGTAVHHGGGFGGHGLEKMDKQVENARLREKGTYGGPELNQDKDAETPLHSRLLTDGTQTGNSLNAMLAAAQAQAGSAATVLGGAILGMGGGVAASQAPAKPEVLSAEAKEARRKAEELRKRLAVLFSIYIMFIYFILFLIRIDRKRVWCRAQRPLAPFQPWARPAAALPRSSSPAPRPWATLRTRPRWRSTTTRSTRAGRSPTRTASTTSPRSAARP